MQAKCRSLGTIHASIAKPNNPYYRPLWIPLPELNSLHQHSCPLFPLLIWKTSPLPLFNSLTPCHLIFNLVHPFHCPVSNLPPFVPPLLSHPPLSFLIHAYRLLPPLPDILKVITNQLCWSMYMAHATLFLSIYRCIFLYRPDTMQAWFNLIST